MSQDSIVIYRDIKEAVMDLPPELCKKVLGVLFDYAFDDKEPDEGEEVMVKSFFKVVKSRFDMNAARRERNSQNGKKGGNPNFAKGKKNPYYKGKDTDAEEENRNITQDNQNATESAEEDNREISEDKAYQYPYQYNNIVVDVDNAHTRESEEQDGNEEQQEEEKEAKDYNAFLNEFFKETNRSYIEVICMQLQTDPNTLRKEAEEIIAEWRLTKVRHEEYRDKAQHLVNRLRVRYNLKLKEDGRKQKQPAGTAAAKDRFNGICETPTKKRHLRSTI